MRLPMMSLLALIALPAWAYTPPAYTPDESLYIVPRGTSVNTTETQTALSEAAYPVVVVFANDVMDDERGDAWSSDTEDAIEDTWELWSTADGFDANTTSIVLVGMDEREVRILTGSAWDVELNLRGSVLTELTDTHFVPYARAGNLDAAAAKTVQALDEQIAAGIAWNADAPAREARAAAERRERELRLAQLQEEQREAAAREAIARQQANDRLRKVAGFTGAGFVGLSALGGAGAWAAGRARRRRTAQERFEEAYNEMNARYEQASQLVADLRLETEARDGVLALRIKGTQTNLLLDAVTAAIDHIHIRLDAMGFHLKRLKERAQTIGRMDEDGFRALLKELESGFSYMPKPDGSLFNQPKQVVVDFPTFETELQTRYDEAKLGWTRLLDAVETSMRRASDDLPLDGLQETMTLVTDLDLPLGWAQEHPLCVDAQAAWAELDALRLSDPVHYLDILDTILEEEDDRIDLLRAVEQAREDLALAHGKAVAIQLPEQAVLTEDQDPATSMAEAVAAAELFEDLVADMGDGDLLVEAADAARAAYAEVLTRCAAVVEAKEAAPRQLVAATRELDALRSEFVKEREELGRLSEVHSNLAHAWQELSESSEDQQQASSALGEAERHIERGAWLTALDALEVVVTERQEALEDLRQLRTITHTLKQQRSEALTVWNSLDSTRSSMAARLVRLGLDINKPLRDGDKLLDTLRAEWSGAGDWNHRSQRVQAIVRSWRRETEAAEQSERLRVAQVAEASRRAAWSTTTSSSGWGSSHSSSNRSSGWGSSRSSRSRKSSSSYRSSRSTSRSSRSYSSSRSRSSGSSYSSSRSRSGGSSFKSSGGRSGGSKW